MNSFKDYILSELVASRYGTQSGQAGFYSLADVRRRQLMLHNPLQRHQFIVAITNVLSTEIGSGKLIACRNSDPNKLVYSVKELNDNAKISQEEQEFLEKSLKILVPSQGYQATLLRPIGWQGKGRFNLNFEQLELFQRNQLTPAIIMQVFGTPINPRTDLVTMNGYYINEEQIEHLVGQVHMQAHTGDMAGHAADYFFAQAARGQLEDPSRHIFGN